MKIFSNILFFLFLSTNAQAILLYKSYPFSKSNNRDIVVQTTMINNRFYVTTAFDKRYPGDLFKTKTSRSYIDASTTHHQVCDWVINRHMHSIAEETEDDISSSSGTPKVKSPRSSSPPRRPQSPKKKRKTFIVTDEIDLTNDPEPVLMDAKRDVIYEQLDRDVDSAWTRHVNVKLLEDMAQLEAELE